MIRVVLGDITKQNVDAVVNAANAHLFHGGGVARAIANADDSVWKTSKEYIQKHGPLKVSECVALKAKKWEYVIHVVGPRGTKPELLKKAIRCAFEKAKELKLKSIAIPPISTGIFGFDKELGCKILVDIAKEYENDFDEIILISVDKDSVNYMKSFLHK